MFKRVLAGGALAVWAVWTVLTLAVIGGAIWLLCKLIGGMAGGS